jgi:hypothetical protein
VLGSSGSRTQAQKVVDVIIDKSIKTISADDTDYGDGRKDIFDIRSVVSLRKERNPSVTLASRGIIAKVPHC